MVGASQVGGWPADSSMSLSSSLSAQASFDSRVNLVLLKLKKVREERKSLLACCDIYASRTCVGLYKAMFAVSQIWGSATLFCLLLYFKPKSLGPLDIGVPSCASFVPRECQLSGATLVLRLEEYA